MRDEHGVAPLTRHYHAVLHGLVEATVDAAAALTAAGSAATDSHQQAVQTRLQQAESFFRKEMPDSTRSWSAYFKLARACTQARDVARLESVLGELARRLQAATNTTDTSEATTKTRKSLGIDSLSEAERRLLLERVTAQHERVKSLPS